VCDVLVPLGWRVEVNAETSRFIDFGRRVMKDRLSAGWDAAVIFLGNNYNGDQIDYAATLNDMVVDFGDIPVVLLTVTEFNPDRAEVNEAILALADLYPNVRLLDWGAISASDAERLLADDGLHLTDAGRQALADSIGLTLGEAPDEPGDCLPSDYVDDSEGSIDGSGTTTTSTTIRRTNRTTTTTVRPGGTTTTVRPGGTTTTVRPGGTTTTVRQTTTTAPAATTTASPPTTDPPPTDPPPAT
jgi:hypothetical protein